MEDRAALRKLSSSRPVFALHSDATDASLTSDAEFNALAARPLDESTSNSSGTAVTTRSRTAIATATTHIHQRARPVVQ